MFWCSCATFEGCVLRFCLVLVGVVFGWVGIARSGFLVIGCYLVCGCCGIGLRGFEFEGWGLF